MLSSSIAYRKSQNRNVDDGLHRHSYPLGISSFYAINRTQSEASGVGETSTGRTHPSAGNPYKHKIEQLQAELDEPCKACMYTGMATCAGLSVYFVKLATDDTTLPKNRRFLWACSAGWIVAGAYRWYIG